MENRAVDMLPHIVGVRCLPTKEGPTQFYSSNLIPIINFDGVKPKAIANRHIVSTEMSRLAFSIWLTKVR